MNFPLFLKTLIFNFQVVYPKTVLLTALTVVRPFICILKIVQIFISHGCKALKSQTKPEEHYIFKMFDERCDQLHSSKLSFLLVLFFLEATSPNDYGSTTWFAVTGPLHEKDNELECIATSTQCCVFTKIHPV